MRVKFILAALAGGVGIASAHHSAGAFDQSKTLTVHGTVKVFQWTNPHVWLWVDVPSKNGTVTEWGFEAGPTNFLKRGGVHWDSLKAGDVVTVKFHPIRDGRAGGTFLGATLADGSTVANGPKFGKPGGPAPAPGGGVLPIGGTGPAPQS